MTTFQKVWLVLTPLSVLVMVLNIVDGDMWAVINALCVGYGVAILLEAPK